MSLFLNVMMKPSKFLSLTIRKSLCASAAAMSMKDEIDKMVKAEKVVVFMKGVPEQPRCGFSNAVVQVLRMHGVHYNAHDVLENEALRNAIKEYSNWPTIPQVYVLGEFIGGCDILMQLHQSGEFIEILKKAGIQSTLEKEDSKRDS